MSTRTFARHRSTAAVVAGALVVVGVAGLGTVAGSQRGDAQQQLSAANGAAPYGIGEVAPSRGIENSENTESTQSQNGRDLDSLGYYDENGDFVHPWEQGGGDAPAPSDRRRQGTPWSTQRGATTEIDRGVRMSSAPGVVLIDTKTSAGEGLGTGMVLTADGQVLTNYHVVEGSESVQVTVSDTGRSYSAKVLGADKVRDVALLQLDGADKLATVTVSEAAARLGDTVYAVGNGNGQGFLTRLDGKVTGVNQAIDVSEGAMFGPSVKLDNLIETDADVVPGYSGGPLLDAKGQVIGVTTAASVGRSIDGYATPIGEAMGVVEQVRSGREGGNVRIGPKGALGVQVATDPQVRGGVVVGLPEGSAAAGAGIARGDVITAIDGKRVGSGDQLASAVGALEPGTQVEVTWQTTAGSTRTATVTLGTSPVN